jgi:hypothetical protein
VQLEVGPPAEEPTVLFEGAFHPSGHSFALSDADGRVIVFTMGSEAPFRNAAFDQYLSEDYRPVILDVNGHVIDASTQRMPHETLPMQLLVNYYEHPFLSAPVRAAVCRWLRVVLDACCASPCCVTCVA